METFAICDKNIIDVFPEANVESLNFYEKNIHFALLDIDYGEYFCKEILGNSVLVKVQSFSCNYRDKSLLMKFSSICESKSNRHYIE